MKEAIVIVLQICSFAAALSSRYASEYEKPTLLMEEVPTALLSIESLSMRTDRDDGDEAGNMSIADSAALSFRTAPENAWAELPSFLQISSSKSYPQASYLLVSTYKDSGDKSGQVWAVPLHDQFEPYVLIQNLTRPVEMCYDITRKVLNIWELGEESGEKDLHFLVETQEQGRIVAKKIENKQLELDCNKENIDIMETQNDQIAAICGSNAYFIPQKANLFISVSFHFACDSTNLYLASPNTGQIYSLPQASRELLPIATIDSPRSIVAFSSAQRTDLALLLLAWL
jgi:hypothetical protein